jgi:hypothetical protein
MLVEPTNQSVYNFSFRQIVIAQEDNKHESLKHCVDDNPAIKRRTNYSVTLLCNSKNFRSKMFRMNYLECFCIAQEVFRQRRRKVVTGENLFVLKLMNGGCKSKQQLILNRSMSLPDAIYECA